MAPALLFPSANHITVVGENENDDSTWISHLLCVRHCLKYGTLVLTTK